MDVKSIAIIGAGSAGLAAAKYLLAENKFSRIVIYEQRASTGGVWNTNSLQQEPGFSIPRASPSSAHEYAVVVERDSRDGHAAADARVALVSPVYDDLETNIPHTLMRYTDLAFPAGTPLFPAHETVLAYLRRYGQDVEHLATFATQVRDVRKTVAADDGTSAWRVEVQDIKSGAVSAERFDAVVVASGHYSDPFVPDVPGIAAFEAAHPGAIVHSKFYRRPAQFTGKKVLVVGNSASGIDISRQIATTAQLPVLISEKDAPGTDNSLPAPTTWSRHVGQVASLLPATRSVRFTSGHVESSIDSVVFCTGYHYSFPFLSSLAPTVLAPDGTYADHLWEHMLYVADPTLAFLAVPKRVVPFPLAEAQVAVIARLWAGRLTVPPKEEREAWVRRRREETAPGARHTLAYPQDADYINRLHALSKGARPPRGLEREGAGKEPPFWDEETSWVRSQIFAIKLASRELGERRKECKTLADLGFDFHAAKQSGTSIEST
ncbi:thiol-specific monooxygenase [Beauveria bassiana ARSEF 2860]|uniref:Thiol-specific monooxygenase n=1 Tax=Beauveria bassiana (strain ARSEF 2860) TaxID=655819 RepID=J5JYA5_BEAB2|nr:thiol-specific monooxygenase [Beauveria bassiana ARSEF 2860]EJP69443.1 thiol-specific monooxygenase [Beauveria bassiana ARSEF 2860]